MYRDIIDNYDKFSNSLKSNYPEIIVGVISVINQGMDTKANKINTINLAKYYQSRKQQAVIRKMEPLTATAIAINKKKLPLPKNDLVESLYKITKRTRPRTISSNIAGIRPEED